MNSRSRTPRGYLPRLSAEHYRGRAMVLWTHTVANRAVGWLGDRFHASFREAMLHVAAREQLLCPAYALMPDHLHLVWLGVADGSDQRVAAAFLRAVLEPGLGPVRFQHQPHDRVLSESERELGAFRAVCAYVLANPVRGGLCEHAHEWAYSGCVVPGYPRLDPRADGFWEKFWSIYNACSQRGGVGKRG